MHQRIIDFDCTFARKLTDIIDRDTGYVARVGAPQKSYIAARVYIGIPARRANVLGAL